MKYGLIIFILTLLSCAKDDTNIVTSSDLKGKWVEIETRTDTLSFGLLGDSEMMNLERGKEIRNGYLLPKLGSGLYNYNLTEEKISLNWMLSSNASFKDYYLKIIGNTLNIGNFYDSTSGKILTFKKLD